MRGGGVWCWLGKLEDGKIGGNQGLPRKLGTHHTLNKEVLKRSQGENSMKTWEDPQKLQLSLIINH